MKEGCITERGTHEELMNLNGDYATIFNNLLLGETPHVEVRLAAICTYLFSVPGVNDVEISAKLSVCVSLARDSIFSADQTTVA